MNYRSILLKCCPVLWQLKPIIRRCKQFALVFPPLIWLHDRFNYRKSPAIRKYCKLWCICNKHAHIKGVIQPLRCASYFVKISCNRNIKCNESYCFRCKYLRHTYLIIRNEYHISIRIELNRLYDKISDTYIRVQKNYEM